MIFFFFEIIILMNDAYFTTLNLVLTHFLSHFTTFTEMLPLFNVIISI